MRTEHITLHARSAGDVKRYSGWYTLRIQTNAHHTWNVARIYLELWGLPRAEVLQYILHHDSGELRAGDVAHHVKAANPELKAFMDAAEQEGREALGIGLPVLTRQEAWRFKCCDLLEMAEFAAEEQEMGNARMRPVTSNIEWALWGQLRKLHALEIDSAEIAADERTLMAWIRHFNRRCLNAGGFARDLVMDGVDRR